MKKRTPPRTSHRSVAPGNRHSTRPPRILIACGDGRLNLSLAVSLADICPNIEVVSTAEQLEERVRQGHYDLVVTRFVSLLVGSRSLPHRLRGEGVSVSFFALLPPLDDEVGGQLCVRLLEGGVAQVLSLPLSTARLHRKAEEWLKRGHECCICPLLVNC